MEILLFLLVVAFFIILGIAISKGSTARCPKCGSRVTAIAAGVQCPYCKTRFIIDVKTKKVKEILKDM